MSNQTFLDPFLKGRPTEAARQAATRILAGPHLSVLSTTNRDGSPQTSVIFVKPDGDDVLFSTVKGRLKTVNMQRDPRVSLLVHSLPGEGGEITYAAISGSVQLTDGSYTRSSASRFVAPGSSSSMNCTMNMPAGVSLRARVAK